MRTVRAGWPSKVVYGLLAVTCLGLAGLLATALLYRPPAPPLLPQRVEWQPDPAAARPVLALPGLTGRPQGLLIPLADVRLPLPGLAAGWRLLAAAPRADQRDGFDGLQLFTRGHSGRAAPLLVKALPGLPLAVAVRDRSLWLACKHAGVQLVDLARPREPVLHQRYAAGWLDLAAFAGRRAYLLADEGRLEILDLATPGAPRLVARHALGTAGERLVGIQVRAERLLLLWENLQGSIFLDSFRLDQQGNLAGREGRRRLPVPAPSLIASGGELFYLATDTSRLYGIDCRDPLRPRLCLDAQLSAGAVDLVRVGDRLLAELVDGTLYALPAEGDPRGGAFLGGLATGYGVRLIFAAGQVYAFSREQGLEVFAAAAVEPPARPGDPPGWPGSDRMRQAVALAAGSAMIDRDGTVRLLAGSAAEQVPPAGFPAGPEARWLAAGADRLYVGGGGSLTVLRSTGRGTLERAGAVPAVGGSSWGGTVRSGILYVAAGRQGVVAYSLADPDAPRPLPAPPLPSLLQPRLDVRDLTWHGRQLVAAGGPAGLLFLAPAPRQGARLIGVMPCAAPVRAVAATGNLLLVAAGDGLDLLAGAAADHPPELQLLGHLPLAGIERLAVDGGRLLGRSAAGWRALTLPVLLGGIEGDPPRLTLPDHVLPGAYRLLLYNRQGTSEWPEPVTVPPAPRARAA